MLAAALAVCRASGGAFDPAVGALVDAWGFGAVRDAPDAAAIRAAAQAARAAHGVIELQDLAVATSGDYRRFFETGGVRVAHTMDARRAAPVRNDVASVTVLARDTVSADAWATALLVAGPGEGLALAQRVGLEVLYLLRRDGRWVELGLGRFGAGPVLSRSAA